MAIFKTRRQSIQACIYVYLLVICAAQDSDEVEKYDVVANIINIVTLILVVSAFIGMITIACMYSRNPPYNRI